MKQRAVEDIVIKRGMTTEDLCRQYYRSGGFSAKKLGESVGIMSGMLKDKKCVKFLSFPACICATGTRGVLRHMVEKRMADVIITTCGTLDHDIARVWRDYYHGDFGMDDRKLHRKGVNRLGNVIIPNSNYGTILEKKMTEFLGDIAGEKKRWSTKELVWALGKKLDKTSILYWAWRNEIPVFVPGITDGAVGSQLWMYYQNHRDFAIDLFRDEDDLAEIVFRAKRTGALILGGGISKHHVIWWNQYRGGLDYAVYITTAEEYDGSLSGARLREAISWGKLRETAKHVTLEGDATVLLPLIVSALG
jgi:deoxyhypusine synthase